MKLSQLSKEKKTIQVDFEGESLAVTFKQNYITPELIDSMSETITGGKICNLMAQMLVEWYLLDEAGEKIAPTYEVLLKLPLTFLQIVMEAIVASMKPADPKG